jgi:bifunctional non-homologous end joining protein LigD
MLAAKRTADPGAVWDSRAGLAADKRAARARGSGAKKAAATEANTKSSSDLPDFIPPQLCESVERPPNGPGWAHEIKFDGYRVQLRVQGEKFTLKTRKGLDWTAKFGAIADAASELPAGIVDGEIVAVDSHAPDFAALQAALSKGKTKDLIFFAFDFLFDGGHDLRKHPLTVRKERLRQMLAKRENQDVIRFVEHFETGGEAVLRSACKLSLEGSCRKSSTLSMRPVATADQCELERCQALYRLAERQDGLAGRPSLACSAHRRDRLRGWPYRIRTSMCEEKIHLFELSAVLGFTCASGEPACGL